MSNINAGIARGQMLHANEHVEMKKAIYERYREGFKDLPVMMNPYEEKRSAPNFWLSCMLIDKEHMGEQVRNGRARTSAYIAGGIVDVGADIFDRGICLPSDLNMTAEEQAGVIEIIKDCFA